MRKRLTSLVLLIMILALSACHAKARPANSQPLAELSVQDFETAYELGKSFIRDFYEHKAGRDEMDFAKYISSENLLEYSNRRIEVETHVYDIKEILVGLERAQFNKYNCFDLKDVVHARDSSNGGCSDLVEILISAGKGKLVVADWYIACGAGISFFDESYRPNATIDSPDVWDDQEFVQALFEKAGMR